MSELELRRFKKDNKDLIETIQILDERIKAINKKLGSYDREDTKNYIDILCDEGAVATLYTEKRKSEKLLNIISPDYCEKDLAAELFGGVE